MTIRATLGALCCAALVVGCSSEAEPRTLPPVAAASPSVAVLPVPPEATPATAEGAAAFVRYYLELLNQAFEAGDSSAVRAISDAGCGGCNNLMGAVEASPAPGERVEGGAYEVVFAESPPVEDGDVIVDLRYSLGEVRVLGTSGEVLRVREPVKDVDAQVRLVRRGTSWVVMGFRNVEP